MARKNYPDEFKRDAVALYRDTEGATITQIADELGIDVTASLLGNNAPNIARIAQTWNTTWNLKPGTESAVIAKHFHAIQVTVPVAIAPGYRSGCVR